MARVFVFGETRKPSLIYLTIRVAFAGACAVAAATQVARINSRTNFSTSELFICGTSGVVDDHNFSFAISEPASRYAPAP